MGKRGVGKTSLAKVLAEMVSDCGIKIVNSDTINCDATDDFSSLWHKALRELTFKIKTANGFAKSGTEKEQKLDNLVGPKVTPDDVRRALSTLPERSVIVFDEFDRIQDKNCKMLMADTIKNLSDHNSDATLLIVGVAASVSELIAEHLSIERAVVEVPMPRMSNTELKQITDLGLQQSKMNMSATVKDKIIRLSHGLPHYTHLLSLESGLAAVDRQSEDITDEDFVRSVDEIVKKQSRP